RRRGCETGSPAAVTGSLEWALFMTWRSSCQARSSRTAGVQIGYMRDTSDARIACESALPNAGANHSETPPTASTHRRSSSRLPGGGGGRHRLARIAAEVDLAAEPRAAELRSWHVVSRRSGE